MMSRFTQLGALALAALTLSGCAMFGRERDAPPPSQDPANAQQTDRGFLSRVFGGSQQPNVGPCPAVRVLYDAQRFVEVTGDEVFANVGYTGEITGVRGFCRYVGTDPIAMELEIDFALGKGPKAQGASKAVSYWVAVTRRDVAPIGKADFSFTATFPPGTDRVALTDKVERIIIPRANKDISGVNFEVLVGFELTPQQLQFNRDGKRFRVDAGLGRS